MGRRAALAALVMALTVQAAAAPGSLRRLDLLRGDRPIDAGIDGAGAVYLLYRGFPRLTILHDGAAVELDLPEVAVPGGICVLEGGQPLVSDRAGNRVLRYSEEGELLEVLEAPGSPGDVAAVGLEVWYVSREDCLIRAAGDGRVVFRPPEGCRPDSPEEMRVYGGASGGAVAAGSVWRLSPGRRPRMVFDGCLDAAMAAGRAVLLVDSSTAVLLPADTLSLPATAGRAAGSPSGGLLFWSGPAGAIFISE